MAQPGQTRSPQNGQGNTNGQGNQAVAVPAVRERAARRPAGQREIAGVAPAIALLDARPASR